MAYGNIQALLTFLIGCIFAVAVYFIGTRFRKRFDGSESIISDILVTASGIPAVLTILAISAFVSVRYIADIPDIAIEIMKSSYVQVLYVIIGGIILTIFVKNLLDLLNRTIVARTSSDFDDKLVHFLQSVYTYVIWIGVFFIVLSVLQIDITPLLATGGVVGIIVGLAAQDTFGNFFSGAMIAADQPFREGDRIEIQGVTGDVVSVGPRSTRIKTLDNQLVTVPNKILTENMLTNFVLPEISIKIRLHIGVGYGSDTEQVRSLLLKVAHEGIQAGFVNQSPEPAVYFIEFGPSALIFQLLVWSDQYDQTLEIRDFLNSRIITRFREAGIEIPYPQMDLHLKNYPPVFK
jgi:small-conductance mechanosensitive channel